MVSCLLESIVNGILSTSSRNTGLSTSSTRTPQRYGLKTVRHHTVDTEYRVKDSKLRILRQFQCKSLENSHRLSSFLQKKSRMCHFFYSCVSIFFLVCVIFLLTPTPRPWWGLFKIEYCRPGTVHIETVD
jgi:hypothetical protein